MKIQFNVFKIDNMASYFNDLSTTREFIPVGKKKVGNEECYLVHAIDEQGIRLINGLNIQESAFMCPKKELVKKDYERAELDIPKEYLTLGIVEEIQNLNNY
ncbi:hypothetical protein [Clostridium perfringens]|uniref:hypothetical protein n=1 Tax=Clostridium perfringens TaxID=1502 RepID=UPI00232E3C6F|nr:hypothetical protein [Clostridium perfringens]MDB2049609.1 hypothetical protein [Clostridium perfringens]